MAAAAAFAAGAAAAPAAVPLPRPPVPPPAPRPLQYAPPPPQPSQQQAPPPAPVAAPPPGPQAPAAALAACGLQALHVAHVSSAWLSANGGRITRVFKLPADRFEGVERLASGERSGLLLHDADTGRLHGLWAAAGIEGGDAAAGQPDKVVWRCVGQWPPLPPAAYGPALGMPLPLNPAAGPLRLTGAALHALGGLLMRTSGQAVAAPP